MKDLTILKKLVEELKKEISNLDLEYKHKIDRQLLFLEQAISHVEEFN